MKRNYDNLIKSVEHLKVLHELLSNPASFTESSDYEKYKHDSEKFSELMDMAEVEMHKQLYNPKSRQMILADILEYIFLARGFFFMAEGSKSKEKKMERKKLFIKSILRFVNMLMSYESMTVDSGLRKQFLDNLAVKLPEVASEDLFDELRNFSGKVACGKKSDSSPKVSNYFDKTLPKTAGGLWHELLVYIFMLRKDFGYIIPLLLTQKFISGSGILVPPDYLLVTYSKEMYGVEVGNKKEIQSGNFSLMTNIPTATIDTINSRCSDRCPICMRWIHFCDEVIDNYSNLGVDLPGNPNKSGKIKCLEACKKYSKAEIAMGKCHHTKYSRQKTKSIKHVFTNGYHYHYRCVLKALSASDRDELISTRDNTAIITHYPYYQGLEALD